LPHPFRHSAPSHPPGNSSREQQGEDLNVDNSVSPIFCAPRSERMTGRCVARAGSEALPRGCAQALSCVELRRKRGSPSTPCTNPCATVYSKKQDPKQPSCSESGAAIQGRGAQLPVSAPASENIGKVTPSTTRGFFCVVEIAETTHGIESRRGYGRPCRTPATEPRIGCGTNGYDEMGTAGATGVLSCRCRPGTRAAPRKA